MIATKWYWTDAASGPRPCEWQGLVNIDGTVCGLTWLVVYLTGG
jgi:hypothetical protein